jgi:hypothetical protein
MSRHINTACPGAALLGLLGESHPVRGHGIANDRRLMPDDGDDILRRRHGQRPAHHVLDDGQSTALCKTLAFFDRMRVPNRPPRSPR